MDRDTRNLLRNTVVQCRQLLEMAVAQQLEGRYGIHRDGKIEHADRMGHLSEDERVARAELVEAVRHVTETGASPSEAVQRLAREIAFTHLNRLVAFKMMEDPSRRIVREAIGRGRNSKGFKFYLADHPEDHLRWQSGREEEAYWNFLLWLGRTLASEIPALFSEADPANRVAIPARTLEQVLALLNDEKLRDVWAEDETIGWVYQYFTPKEVRDQARQESPAPRNADELAFLNQFYTPRYVVQFLVDNTLGRLWHEMRRGQTVLGTICRYLVLTATGEASQQALVSGQGRAEASGDSQGPRKKDPRDIRILDPACGSGHFLLYAYDLFERIYHEAWQDPDPPVWEETGRNLRQDYPDRHLFEIEVPRLILRCNLHGIDIDARAVQITAVALWLRVQRSFQEMGLARELRPSIERSNIVVAEAIPGEQELFEEFLATLEPPVQLLLREAFGRMHGIEELGSLLCIEEEIREVVDQARSWSAQRQPVQSPLPLPEVMKPEQEQLPLELRELGEETFWRRAEALVFEALKAYAERAANGKGYARRLFAQDTARGFAFVEVSRRTFDVVVMNPPFGDGTAKVKNYLNRRFRRSKQDLACAFVDRWFQRLNPGGRLGVIMTRTPFFLSSSTEWREQLILQEAHLETFSDLGYGVLEAMVETAACTLWRDGDTGKPGLFFRLVQEPEESKGNALEQAIADPSDSRRFCVEADSFRQVPNSPLAYWVSERVRRLFKESPPFEGNGRTVKVGLQTSDDFRFVRAWWEVPTDSIVTGTSSDGPDDLRRRTFEGKRWVPFAKGGEYSPYYADLHLVVDWERDGEALRRFPGSVIRNAQFYFRPGLTWPLRARAFCPQVLPGGTIFSVRGYAILAAPEQLLSLLGLGSSVVFDYIFKVMLGRSGFPEFIVGILKKLPVPRIPTAVERQLADIAREGYWHRCHLAARRETSRMFQRPELAVRTSDSLSDAMRQSEETREHTEREFASLQARLDEMALVLYGITETDLDSARRAGEFVNAPYSGNDDAGTEVDTRTDTAGSSDVSSAVADLLSWSVGVVFGRFDIRAANHPLTGNDTSPFAPLQAHAPGMLSSEVLPEDYPMGVVPHGIAVDDSSRSGVDIVGRVGGVLEYLWGERAEAIEQGACAILGVADLRTYFRNPRGFFGHHVRRYSASSRKAPIYWLLQSPKRHYSLWLYYHRLDSDTLHKALHLYVEPKIRMEEAELERLRVRQRQAGEASSSAPTIARDVERQEEVLADLQEFRARLVRVADLNLRPDLHDGVILNMAPLHELIPWQEPKKHWDELCAGKYPWSSIAQQLRARGLVKA